jgi:hypothetical protein
MTMVVVFIASVMLLPGPAPTAAQEGERKEDILTGMHESIATRVMALVRIAHATGNSEAAKRAKKSNRASMVAPCFRGDPVPLIAAEMFISRKLGAIV